MNLIDWDKICETHKKGLNYDKLKASHDKLMLVADEGLHECERVKMHCTCNKDLAGLLARIERIEQALKEAGEL